MMFLLIGLYVINVSLALHCWLLSQIVPKHLHRFISKCLEQMLKQVVVYPPCVLLRRKVVIPGPCLSTSCVLHRIH